LAVVVVVAAEPTFHVYVNPDVPPPAVALNVTEPASHRAAGLVVEIVGSEYAVAVTDVRDAEIQPVDVLRACA
jgi:hypothetical protein